MRFAKWQGLGNHYVIVERSVWPIPMNAQRAALVCDPHFGVGGNGVLEIAIGSDDVPEMIVWNPDGSNSENCGNGIRMVARYLEQRGLLPEDGTIRTGGGPVRVTVRADGTVRVEMGAATFPDGRDRERLEVAGSGEAVDFAFVSVGNPHAIIDHPDPAEAVQRLGPPIEVDPRFPDRVNVEFVREDGPGEVTMRVWERGVGETMACGTGACAVGVAAVVLNGHESPVTVHLAGGDLEIAVDKETLEVTMTGPAEEIFVGEISPGLTVALGAAE